MIFFILFLLSSIATATAMAAAIGNTAMITGEYYVCPNATLKSSTKLFPTTTKKNRLRIMQYNVEWLFVNYFANSDCPGNGCTWKNQTHAQEHLEHVAKVVADLNPDILNLCEVEGCSELQMLIDQMMMKASAITSASASESAIDYQAYLVKGTDTATGQNVGILSRIPLEIPLLRTELKKTFPIPGSKCGYTGAAGTQGVSKHYLTHFHWAAAAEGGIQVALIGAHLLANPTDPQRCAEREAQAQILAELARNQTQLGYEVILWGDFNDYDGEILDENNHLPTSQVLEILKNATSPAMISSASFVENQSLRASDWWDADGNCFATANEYSMIDHVLMTPAIARLVRKVEFYRTGYVEDCSKLDSDHYPVVVDFDLLLG